jgi:hypothetical protein
VSYHILSRSFFFWERDLGGGGICIAKGMLDHKNNNYEKKLNKVDV